MSRFSLPLIALALFLGLSGSTGQASSPGHYRDFGDPGGFLNILPPGQDGLLNGPEALAAQAGQYPPHFRDQLPMYGDLVYATPNLSEDNLSQYFKDASFGVPDSDIDRTYSPTEGVVVVRDKTFGVPHIFGETRYATFFAQGYTGAEDRLFLMDVLRHVGRARVSEFLGASPANQDLDRDQLAVAPYREEDLTAQLLRAQEAAGPDAETMRGDLLAYVEGVNRYIQEALADPGKMPAEYFALQQVPAQWKAEDIVAVASLVGGVFGRGGGRELANCRGLQQMADSIGEAGARAVFDDLHFANDAEAPTTSSHPAPYMTDLGPVNPSAHPDIDCGSLRPVDDGETSVDDLLAAVGGEAGTATVDAPWGAFALDLSSGMSNALLVSAEHSASGSPIAVFGPQTGYFVPQLLVEKDVHGPGIDARGAAFAGTDIYVQLGRGRDYAWSATSAGADNVDTFVLRLCEPDGGEPAADSMVYVHGGACEPIETFQHTQVAKPTAAGVPAEPQDVILSWRVERARHYGPIEFRGTLRDGTPIAVATLRSTYMNELGSAPGFFRVNNPDFMTDGFASFRQAMGNGVHYTFNWFYVDDTDIGYQHSCRCPQRAQGVDPYLPVWGTGEWDWQGFIPFEAQPWELNPEQGYLTSWNNKQAPGFKANDGQFSYGPVYRSEMLDVRIEAAIRNGKIDRVDLVRIMEEAGTVDLRGQEDVPLLLQVMGSAPPPGSDPRLTGMRERLAAWAASGAHHRDLDRDGEYDDAVAPAIMEAWWPELVHAMFDAGSANAIAALSLDIDDHNRHDHLGSAFQGGFFSHVHKDLRQVLGQTVRDPWSRTYCGGGDRETCRRLLWQALADAAVALEAKYGSAGIGDWKWAMAEEDVRHSAVGVTPVPAIHWINRPTFQQVVNIPPPVEVASAFGSGSLRTASGAKTGFVFDVTALSSGEGEGGFRLNDHGGHHKIDVREITGVRTPSGGACGSVPAGGANTLEFWGTGTFDGAAAHGVHVCVQDNGEPGKGVDRLHVDCAGCPYSTDSSFEVLTSGNLRVRVQQPPAEGGTATASVVVLEPALDLDVVPGQAPALGVTVYDGQGRPLSGVPVVLSDATGLLSLAPVLTDSLGQAAVVLPTALAAREWTAVVGGLESNPVLVLSGG